MDEETVAVELSVSDCHSVLSVLKTVIKAERGMDDADAEVIETLILLYEEINRQLEDGDGKGHAQGLYSTSDDS